MNKEKTPDMEWATQQLSNYPEYTWNQFLRDAGEDISGLHETVALVLIAKGLEKRPVEEVIEKLKKEGLANGAGIDSARNK